MAIARVQAAGSGTLTLVSQTVAATFSVSVGVGHGIIVIPANHEPVTACTVTGVSDTFNTYTQFPGAYIANTGTQKIMSDVWYCKNVGTGGTLTVTVTFSDLTGFPSLTVIEVSGQDPVTFADSVGNISTASTAFSVTTTGNTTTPNNFFVGVSAGNINTAASSPGWSPASVASTTTETYATNTGANKVGLNVFDGVSTLASGASMTFSATTPSSQGVAIVCSFRPFIAVSPTRNERTTYETFEPDPFDQLTAAWHHRYLEQKGQPADPMLPFPPHHTPLDAFGMDAPWDDWVALYAHRRYLEQNIAVRYNNGIPRGKTPWDTFGFDQPWDDWATLYRQRRYLETKTQVDRKLPTPRVRPAWEFFEDDPYMVVYSAVHRRFLFIPLALQPLTRREQTPLDMFEADPYTTLYSSPVPRRALPIIILLPPPLRHERTPLDAFAMDSPWDDWVAMFQRRRLPGDVFPTPPLPPPPPPILSPPGKMERVGASPLHGQPGSQLSRGGVMPLHGQQGNQLERTTTHPLHKQTQ
jgi:hypothetical protein